jgi:TnpA family transposase
MPPRDLTPPRYSRRQLKQRASLTTEDFKEINQCRRDYNRLGFAYQVGFVHLLNRFPIQQPFEVIDELLTFIGIQLGANAALITRYQQRQQTISEHQLRIAAYLKLALFGAAEATRLEPFVFEESCRLAQTAALESRVQEFFKEQHILQPAESTVARIIGEQRKHAREYIFEKLATSIPADLAKTLDDLLVVGASETVSGLQKIKANPSKPSADAMLSLTDKLAAIAATGVLAVDLSWLNNNYQRALFHQVRKSSVHRLREVGQPRRHAALACFLWQSYRDAVDQLVDMYDKLLTRIHTKAQNEIDDRMCEQRRTIRASLAAFQSLGEVILDDSVASHELRERLFAAVPRADLATKLNDIRGWVAGNKSDVFHEVVRRADHLRKFSPAFLDALTFVQESAGEETPCLRAVRTLRELNAGHKRTLPEDTPTDFIPGRLRALVTAADGRMDKRAWECALLVTLRDEITAGNLSVTHSKRFGRFDDFFIPTPRWTPAREEFFRRAGLPGESSAVPDYLRQRLSDAYDRFLAAAPTNSYAVVDEQGWHLSADSTEQLDHEAKEKMDRLRSWLDRNMRRTHLPHLLIEVDNELGFTRHFLPAAQQSERVPDDVCVVLAAVLALGCNIGPYTMAQLTRGVSYKQLKRVSDWQMTDESQRSALADLVGAIAGLDTSASWGEGKTSASDGQRFALPRKVLQQTYSTKFSDFALKFYTFVADNYAPFYSTPIECTDRDAAFVLDGLLYNESDLDLEEHYTDTHGYTEINFAAFAMLGRRFCPRIRGSHHQRLYRIDPGREYGALRSLVGRADRTIDTRLIAEEWDRMGQFYASLQSGHVTASVALRRLAAYSGKNRFYRANRDLGRIFKTEFLLQYMSEPQLRSRIRRGLLKVEQLHALARDVFYGKRGRINARELQDQMNSCSCLTLIVACIVYWQAKEITRVVNECDPEGNGIDVSLLEHVSPIEWDNVVLYGQYVLNRKLIRGSRARP